MAGLVENEEKNGILVALAGSALEKEKKENGNLPIWDQKRNFQLNYMVGVTAQSDCTNWGLD